MWKVACRVVEDVALVDATDAELVAHVGKTVSTILHRAVWKHQAEPLRMVRGLCWTAWSDSAAESSAITGGSRSRVGGRAGCAGSAGGR